MFTEMIDWLLGRVPTEAAQTVTQTKKEKTMTALLHQSRWGWHPCSVEVCRKLKKLNHYCELYYRASAAHGRWSRKLPKNRVRKGKWLPLPVGKWEQIPVPEPKLCPWLLDYKTRDRIAADYYDARMPQKDAGKVRCLYMTVEEIDKLLADVESWYK
jgi:hypothetical protein